MDHSFLKDFEYTSNNPYQEKMRAFNFIYQDKEGERFKDKWQELFKNKNNINVEIGSGFGEFMISYLTKYKDVNLIGIEYRFKRCYQLGNRLNKLNLSNFRLLRAKGERLSFLFGEKEINDLFYFFPDPWVKNRQSKKRLFQENFLKTLNRLVKGLIYFKTDNDDYFKSILELSSKYFKVDFFTNDLINTDGPLILKDFTTKFENIFLKQGVKIKAMVLNANP